jgi:trimeric autotransporter adhesin
MKSNPLFLRFLPVFSLLFLTAWLEPVWSFNLADDYSGQGIYNIDNGIASDNDRWGAFPYISSSVNNNVLAVAVDGDDLYVGGLFTQAGAAPAGYIARWDGSAWHTLGSGLNGAVHALHLHDGQLYAGGDFTQAGGLAANRIARWDGEQWHAIGSGFNNTVRAIAVTELGLFAGGQFTESANQPGYFLSKWDGEAWTGVGEGLAGQVFALATMGNDLYIGGDFTFAGGEPINRITRWDGETYHPLGGGADNIVRALYVDGSDLYIGGSFVRVDGVISEAKTARWDGEQWHHFAGGITGATNFVAAITKLGNQICIAGNFTFASSIRVNNLACWNGIFWTGRSGGTNGRIFAMDLYGNGLVLGGEFTTGSHFVTTWRDGDFWGLDSGNATGLTGLNGFIYATVTKDDDLYVGGRFTGAGGKMTNHITRWDGLEWHPLGDGFNSEVYSVTTYNDDLYAGGFFTLSGGESVRYIGRWDGQAWHPVGGHTSAGVTSLVVWNGDLYASGQFQRAGGNVVNNIARWDGEQWHDLAGGTNGQINALLVMGDYLYAGGSFSQAGGAPANRLARWDGVSWEAISSELDNTVHALAEWKGDLYVGGQFMNPGSRIARWNGQTWDQPGPGMGNQVFAFYPTEDVLYAGGIFFTVGTLEVRSVAAWDGDAWSALGSGVNGRVNSFITYNNRLMVAGVFTEAGGQPSNFLASWRTGDIQTPAQVLPAEPANGATGVDPRAVLSWNAVEGATSYDLEIATDAGFTNVISPVAGLTETSVNYSTDPLPPLTQLWWRVRANTNGVSGEWSEGWTFTTSTLTSIAERPELPNRLTLDQNYPNPFNPATVIRFGLPEQTDVRLEVYTLAGQRVARLADGNRTAGWHQVVFDASGLSSGVYFYRLQTPGGTITRKLTVVK